MRLTPDAGASRLREYNHTHDPKTGEFTSWGGQFFQAGQKIQGLIDQHGVDWLQHASLSQSLQQSTQSHWAAAIAHVDAAALHGQQHPQAAVISDHALTLSSDAGGPRKDAFKALDFATAGKHTQAMAAHERQAQFHQKQVLNRLNLGKLSEYNHHHDSHSGEFASGALTAVGDADAIRKLFGKL